MDKWTNSRALDYYISKNAWKEEYLEGDENFKETIFDVNDHIFAFQEIDKSSYTAQNDKAIYSSITSLYKALGYELRNLPERKNSRKYIYNFNLLSIADTKLIRIKFDDDNINVEQVADKKYVGSFIVNKREVFSRIHFVEWDHFEEKITKYEELHDIIASILIKS